MSVARLTLTALLALFVGSCDSRLLILRPTKPAIAELAAAEDTFALRIEMRENVEVPDRILNKLRRSISKQMRKNGWQISNVGTLRSGLLIEIVFNSYDPGNRILRQVMGGDGYGKGEAVLRVAFKVGGQPAGEIEVTSEVSGGVLGGSFSGAVGTSARTIVRYVNQNLRPPN